MKRQTIKDRANEIAESWINGNLTWAREQVANTRGNAGKILAIEVFRAINRMGDNPHRFLNALYDHYTD